VDAQVTTYHLELIDGIDPNRRNQPFVLVSAIEGEAAA
jgi:hypothetical protein